MKTTELKQRLEALEMESLATRIRLKAEQQEQFKKDAEVLLKQQSDLAERRRYAEITRPLVDAMQAISEKQAAITIAGKDFSFSDGTSWKAILKDGLLETFQTGLHPGLQFYNSTSVYKVVKVKKSDISGTLAEVELVSSGLLQALSRGAA
jgi:hypothetical protein